MKKYLKYLLLIPIFAVSLFISFFILLRIPTEVWGCEGFGCFGLMFLIPQLAVILAIPIAILIFSLLSNKSNFFKNLFLSMKTFVTKPFPKKKLILLLLFIPTLLLILIIVSSLKTDNNLNFQNTGSRSPTPTAGIGETVSQVPDGNLANWKTYRNEEYGFEFKYPTGGIISKGKVNSVFLEYPDKSDTIPVQFIEIDLIFIPKTLDNQSLKEFAEEQVRYNKNLRFNVTENLSNIIIGNIEGYAYSGYEFMTNSYSRYIFLPQTTKEFIEILDRDGNQGVDQILSTFKFLPNASDINIKYPSTYKKLEKPADGTVYLTNNLVSLSGPTFSRTNYNHTPYLTVNFEEIPRWKCYKKWWDNTEMKDEKTINNTIFRTVNRGGAALGTRYQSVLYRTMKDDICYEILSTIVVSGDWNTVKESDYYPQQEETQKELDQILSTFKFLEEPTPTSASIYKCPENGLIDCMPGPDKPTRYGGCSQDTSPEAIEWYKANCPNYRGITY